MRFLLLAAALVPDAVAQPRYDLLLKGGHVIDPKNQIDAVRDVAIAGGRIARVAGKIDPAEARKAIDAAGLYVTPGLIDIHVHVYRRGRAGEQSIDPDAFTFRTGV